MGSISLFYYLTLVDYYYAAITNSLSEDISVGDTKHCKKNPGILNTFPKYGWDHLVYKFSEKELLFLNYTECRITSDDKYLLPLGLRYIPQSGKSEKKVEVFKEWKFYKPLPSTIMYHGPEFSGSFTEAFQRAKKEIIENDVVIIRVVLEKSYATIQKLYDLPLTTEFVQDLTKIGNHVMNCETELAEYYADQLIMKYGTYYPFMITSGGLLVIEFMVKKEYYQMEKKYINNIAAAAFDQCLNYTVNSTVKDKVGEFLANSTQKAFVIGGIYTNTTTGAEWEKSVEGNQQAFNFTAYSVLGLISPNELPPPIMKGIQTVVTEAITRYNKLNSHHGCTNSNAPNFGFAANTDDGSCNQERQNYTFGGLYQICNGSSELCKGLQLKNPLTSGFTCPESFQTFSLKNTIVELCNENNTCTWRFNESYCKLKCIPEDLVKIAQYEIYWCGKLATEETNEGALFGGMFDPNVITSTCPEGFIPLKVDSGKITVCIGNKSEEKDAVPFGGLWRCSFKNASFPEDYHSCPKGYNKRIVKVDGTCDIYYCTWSDNKEHLSPPIVSPGTRPKPEIDQFPGKVRIILGSSYTFKVYYKPLVDDNWVEYNLLNDRNVTHLIRALQEDGLEELFNKTIAVEPKIATTSISAETMSGFTELTTEQTSTSSTTIGRIISMSTENVTIPTIDYKITEENTLSSSEIAAISISTIVASIAFICLAIFLYKKRFTIRSESRSILYNTVTETTTVMD